MPLPRPRSKAAAVALSALLLALFFGLARLGFIAYFGGMKAFHEAGITRALYLGAKFDLRLALLILLPWWVLGRPGRPEVPRASLGTALLALALALYVLVVGIAMVDDVAARPWLLAFLLVAGLRTWAFPGQGLASGRGERWTWAIFGGGLLAFVVVALLVDAGTYAYIHTRLNGTLLMFLENAGTSLGVIWQTYPVVRLTLATGVLAGGLFLLLRHLLTQAAPLPRSRPAAFGVRFGLSLLLLFGLWGKISAYPLRWAEVFEGRSSFQAHAALNPVLFFLETRRDMDGGYDLEAVKRSHALMADYFGTTPTFDSQGNPSLRREIPPRPLLTGHPNVVFIQLESFAGNKTGILGNPLNPTPFFDSICHKGIFFDRFHVVMENTSRSMFATIFGTPDVSSVEGATRNPLLIDQHSPLHALDDYTKGFFLGGSANWAQIRGTLRNNFPGIELHEEGSWKGPRVDVWGVCDQDLLVETLGKVDAMKAPWWAYVQTSGNHPPFTIPSHIKDFQEITLDEASLRKGNFIGNDEFNSLRFMDHGLKVFFEAAEKRPDFANTVFVLWADHGLPRGNQDPRFGDLTLAIHHVPFLIYAPRLLQPRRVSTVGTQMDIMPTLMALLGRPTRTQTLGKDLLDPAFADKGAAFTFTTFRRPPRTGLIQGDWYLNLNPGGRAELYRLGEPDPRDRAAEDPERTARMKALADGFHAWSRYLLGHNKPSEASR